MQHPFVALAAGQIKNKREELEKLKRFKEYCDEESPFCWTESLEDRLIELREEICKSGEMLAAGSKVR